MRGRNQVLASAVVAGLLLAAAPMTAEASRPTRAVSISSAKHQVTEGTQYSLATRIASPRAARRVTLQQWYVPAFGAPTWRPVKLAKIRGRSRVTFRWIAEGLNSERFRALVTYRTGKPAVSKPVTIKVWRWIPLSDYTPYYATSGAIFGETTLNGRRYRGWGAAYYSKVGAWEARFTPGRHCKAFRGVLGVGDISADGSSGSISFTADDQSVYSSPALTPGMDLPVTLNLAMPYRFGIQAYDTSSEGIDAWPVIGDPEFLCTGV